MRRWEFGVALHPIGNCHWNYPLSKPPQQSIRDPSFLGAGGGSWKFLAASFCIGDSVRTWKREPLEWRKPQERRSYATTATANAIIDTAAMSDVRCDCVSFPSLSSFVLDSLDSSSAPAQTTKAEQSSAVDVAVRAVAGCARLRVGTDPGVNAAQSRGEQR